MFHYRMANRSTLKARINTTLITLHDAIQPGGSVLSFKYP